MLINPFFRFFPGLALYFLIGILVKSFAGHRGKDMIPHGSFWLVLPDLIMVSSFPYLEFLTTLSLLKVKEFMRHEMCF